MEMEKDRVAYFSLTGILKLQVKIALSLVRGIYFSIFISSGESVKWKPLMNL